MGAIAVAKDKIGKDLGEVLGLNKKIGITVSSDADAFLSKTKPDIAIHATSSYLKDTIPKNVKAPTSLLTIKELTSPLEATADIREYT